MMFLEVKRGTAMHFAKTKSSLLRYRALLTWWLTMETVNRPLTLPDRLADEQNVYHLFPILVGGGRRDALHNYLAERGIGTVIHYPIPPHKQECYAHERWNMPQLQLPVTERIAAEELSLPIGPAITVKEAEAVVNCINGF